MGQSVAQAGVEAGLAPVSGGGSIGRAPSRRPYFGVLRVVLAALLVAVAIPAVLLGWRQTGLPGLEAPDRYLYDLRQVWLAKQSPTARPELALLTISEQTIAEYAAQQPVDRALLAKLVTALADSGAAAIGLDFLFDRATDPVKDAALAAAISAARNKVVVGVIDSRSGLPERNLAFQRDFLKQAGNPRVGHLYFDRKRQSIGQPDLAVRWMARRAANADHVPEGFAEVLLAVAGISARDVGQSRTTAQAEVGPHIAWLAPNASDGSKTFLTLEVPSVPPADAQPNALVRPEWQRVLAGRMVIVGGQFEDRDRHLTPFSVMGGGRATGAEIHAQIAAQLKERRTPWPFAVSCDKVLGVVHQSRRASEFLIDTQITIGFP